MDPDIIARVYPYPDIHSQHASSIIQRSQYYMPAKGVEQSITQLCPSRNDRAGTEPAEDIDDDPLDPHPFLELRFSRRPQKPTGFVFGSDKTSDIVLPNIQGISRRQFALTFKKRINDGCYCLIVRDLGSTSGTAVHYKRKDEDSADWRLGRRCGFDWIIGGIVSEGITATVIQPHQFLKFQIVVNNHSLKSSTYIGNVGRFLQGEVPAEDLVRNFTFYSGPQTERGTHTYTPTTDPIIIPGEKLGEGTYGAVTRCWDVSTGREYACKKPVLKNFNRDSWWSELCIMTFVDHRHVVRVLHWQEDPEPLIRMEYLPGGNLRDAHMFEAFDYNDCLTILFQASSAVADLHSYTPPIAHRDIKPENILVQTRHPLEIKLSDFGISKAAYFLETNCGTPRYTAPEVGLSQPYTEVADVWSLAVVVLELACDLPYRPDDMDNSTWCKNLVAYVTHLADQMGGGLFDILRRMLVINPAARFCARQCFRSSYECLHGPLPPWVLELIELTTTPEGYYIPPHTSPDAASLPPNNKLPECYSDNLLNPPRPPVPPHRQLQEWYNAFTFHNLPNNAAPQVPPPNNQLPEVYHVPLRNSPDAAPQPLPPNNQRLPPEKYEFLVKDGVKIAYQPFARTVNLTHLLPLLGIANRQKLNPFFSSHPRVWHEIRQGSGFPQGTYISFDDVSLVCQYYGIRQNPIHSLLVPTVDPAPAGPTSRRAVNPPNSGLEGNGRGPGLVVHGEGGVNLPQDVALVDPNHLSHGVDKQEL
ncbi:kinase-like domain-containing protein [Nemania abortiva]|nr:kinase-like domain-containing protein [Nemania abortiva]